MSVLTLLISVFEPYFAVCARVLGREHKRRNERHVLKRSLNDTKIREKAALTRAGIRH